MNLNDANRIHDAAPDDSDCFVPMKNDGFQYIMELTKEEKRELLKLWRSKNHASRSLKFSNFSIL